MGVGNCPTSNFIYILATQLLRHLEGCDHVGYIPTNMSKSILEGFADSIIALKLKKEKTLQKVNQAMFYQKEHWCFIIVNVNKQRIFFFDPTIECGAPPVSGQQLRNFLKVARQVSIKQVAKVATGSTCPPSHKKV